MPARGGIGRPTMRFHAGATHHDFVEIAYLERRMVERWTVVTLQQKQIVMITRPSATHKIAAPDGAIGQAES